MSSTVSTPHQDNQALLHQTAVALSQVQNLLRQATDIMAHLHTHFLHHIRQADPTFRQHFQQLPPPPTYSINLPSPTSSCDSAPSRPRVRLPPPPSNNSDDTPSPTPTPQPAATRKRKQPPPPPPLNPQADWDAWDGDADCRLLDELASPSSNVRPDGKNYRTYSIYKTNNSPPSHHKRIHNNRNFPLPLTFHRLPPH